MPHSEILGSKPARGSPRLFAACHVLHRLLAPRHPPDALAFLGPHQRQPHHDPTRSTTRRGPRPSATAPTKRRQMRRPPPGAIPASTATTSCWPTARAERQRSGKHTHAKRAPCRRRKKKGRRARLAGTRRTTTHGRESLLAMPARRAPRHHLTMSKEHTPPPQPNRAGGAQTGRRFGRPGRARATTAALPEGKRGLVGLGRLERPTSRLSGVRSNQLSYRPERHPAGPKPRAARAGRTHDRVTRGPRVRRLCAKGRADGGGRF